MVIIQRFSETLTNRHFCFSRAGDNLSVEQKVIVDLVNNGHNVYFGGIAGCGKTFVARKIVEVLSRKKVHYFCLYMHYWDCMYPV